MEIISKNTEFAEEEFSSLITSDVEVERTLYEDNRIIITNTYILLKLYGIYAGDKRIYFSEIVGFKVYKPRNRFMLKWWGCGLDFSVWWHCDIRREFGDRNAIVLDTGARWKIGMTPGSGKLKNCEAVVDILEKFVKC